jgi:uncharacterized protein (TIGR02246 family)
MPQHTDEDRIRALIEDWASAARAKSMNGVLAHHTDDVVMFDVPMPLQSRGIGEYRKTWELFFANSPGGPGAFEVMELQISAGADVAFCHAIFEVMDSRRRLTVGLRKEAGQWRIAHEHHSYPLEAD